MQCCTVLYTSGGTLIPCFGLGALQACPFFVFCIGTSLSLVATSVRWRMQPRIPRVRHILTRTLKVRYWEIGTHPPCLCTPSV